MIRVAVCKVPDRMPRGCPGRGGGKMLGKPVARRPMVSELGGFTALPRGGIIRELHPHALRRAAV